MEEDPLPPLIEPYRVPDRMIVVRRPDQVPVIIVIKMDGVIVGNTSLGMTVVDTN